ncbi:MAG: hypothetical protein CMM29_10445 [Rhodospirillaceae bacterium]|nr:hypothetical protein [Rhodospirillaceae bacterium]MBR87196.1 hypothetical protein [Rhodospirillaceae bacterium]|tara:strand:+ start:1392 stop:1655 length:264 start_codon:yes stop_codon:yes gene_type:complete
MNISEEYKDVLERAVATAVQAAIGVTAGMSLANVDMDAIALVATVAISAFASVVKSGVAQKLVGDDSASLVTLRRDPKTGRFMKKGK